MVEVEEKYMARCIELAKGGRGNVSPNPMVGAVVVHKGRIIGEGFHRKCGEAHAEVNAIASVKDESLLKDSTIYVSLEPCSHYGKTPPCAELLSGKGFHGWWSVAWILFPRCRGEACGCCVRLVSRSSQA